jgi:dipeptidyl aminopeptidase/acylaminoacyl peptidase
MRINHAGVIILLTALLLLSGCVTAARHTSLQQTRLPRLISIKDLLFNTSSRFAYRISPDGKTLAWLAVKGTRLTIHFRARDGKQVERIRNPHGRNIRGFRWAADSRHLYYQMDRDGDENTHIYMVDSRQPERAPVDLTPFENAKAVIHRVVRDDPQHILITHNRRDPEVFDLYRYNLAKMEFELLAENPGDVLAWITDRDGSLRGRIRKTRDDKKHLELKMVSTGGWRPLKTWRFDDQVNVHGFTQDRKGMWLLSNHRRERVSLVRLDLQSGKETLVYADPEYDLGGIMISDLTRKPLVALIEADYPRRHFFDRALARDAELFAGEGHYGLAVRSADYRERVATVLRYTDKGADFYLFDRDRKSKELLARHPLHEYRHELAATRAISFTARDGLPLHGYLTLPNARAAGPLPMVLFVHGGPWARDTWRFNPHVQFLANRGYAVLQVNYRGSHGYGRSFMEAAIGEFAGKMHDDLIDGVSWAVNDGIADRERICIFGGSYGGYATLVGMTFTPGVFACGVDIVGPSNLVTLVESVPDYWRPWMQWWYRYVGNPDDPQQRKEMERRSPLFKAHQVRNPLLIAQGANDPRVKRQESEQIVAALRQAGKEVNYMLFDNEGHGIRRWKNKLKFYRRMEDFLARHLGGRSAGFSWLELLTWWP